MNKQSIILIIILIISLTAISGCTSSNGMVTCSDYHKVLDLYKTPGEEYYMVLEGYNSPINVDTMHHIVIGEYARKLFGDTWISTNLTWLNESESGGYRDACREMPHPVPTFKQEEMVISTTTR